MTAPSLPRALVLLVNHVPNLGSDEGRVVVLGKLSRDLDRVLEEGWSIELWGPRDPGPSVWGAFRARGPVVRRPLSAPARRTLSWLVHAGLTLARPRAGILYANEPSAAAGAAMARRLRRPKPPLVVRAVARNASASFNRNRSRARFRVLDRAERIALSDADLVLPIGGFTEGLARRAGTPTGRILWLPYPTVYEREAVLTRLLAEHQVPAPRREEVRATRAEGLQVPQDGVTLPPDAVRITVAARLAREKGLDVLVRAMPLVIAQVPHAVLDVAGDGQERSALEALAASLGVADRVRFRGWLAAEEMGGFFDGSPVFCLPSRMEEGLGMVLIEAALAGCALVGSAHGGILDVVEDGVSGLTVPPDDVPALAAALIRLLRHPAEAGRLAAGARARAEAFVARREPASAELRERFDMLRGVRSRPSEVVT